MMIDDCLLHCSSRSPGSRSDVLCLFVSGSNVMDLIQCNYAARVTDVMHTKSSLVDRCLHCKKHRFQLQLPHVKLCFLTCLFVCVKYR